MKKIILAMLLVVMLLALTSCSKKMTLDGYVEVTIEKAYCAKSLSSNRMSYYARSGYTYVVVEMDMTNLSPRDNCFRDMLDARLKSSEDDIGAFGTIATLTDSEDLSDGLVVSSGETRRVYCLFQIPEDSAYETRTLELMPSNRTSPIVTAKIKPQK